MKHRQYLVEHKKIIIKTKNGENMPNLEVDEVVLVQCKLVENINKSLKYQIILNVINLRLICPLKSLSTVPAEFQWNSTGVMENYWKMTGTNGTSGIPLKFRWISSSS